MNTFPDSGTPDPSAVRLNVDAVLAGFLDVKQKNAPGPELPALITTLRRFLVGGKRLRPLLCVAGWYAGGGKGDATGVIRAAAGLELFQAFALVHDDVMDASDLRRGRPSAHRELAATYAVGGGVQARAEAHGVGAAILLGDLALVWSDELLHSADSRADRVMRVLELVDAMRSEVVYGQYLDLLSAGRLSGDIEAALRVVRYKTAKYTVERPLHIGAALADAEPAVLEACTAFALPLGEAFQLRDDLLGVYGDSAETGKPVTDDIREGKATVLMALAVRRACEADLKLLRTMMGNPDVTAEDVDRLRVILDATGARRCVEEMIQHRREQALVALERAPFPPGAIRTLRDLAQKATVRRA